MAKMKALAKYLHPKAIGTIGGFSFDPKGLVEGNIAGGHKSPFHGFSVEFAGHREYMPGDDPKHIDWVVYYKRERYMIKQYEAETNLVTQIMLDNSESMRFSSHKLTKLDYAAYLAVSLTHLIVGARDSVGMALFDEKITTYLPASNNMSIVFNMSKRLSEAKLKNKTNIEMPLMDFANRIGRRQIAIIISDFLAPLDGLQQGLARLRYDNHEIVMFHIVDPYELDFPMEGRIKFIGMEGFPEIKLDARAIRKAYIKKMEEHCEKLRDICEKNNAEYQLANTGRPIEELLFGYLTSRLTHVVH